jgi:hypothetical protein
VAIEINEDELPEVVVDRGGDNYTYVKVGSWEFCVEEDLEENRWWGDAKAFLAYARYLDSLRGITTE